MTLLRGFWFRLRGLRRVRVHFLTADPSLEGVLCGYCADHYILRHCSLLETEEKSHVLEGSIWVGREKVFFLQEV